ncbi:MAG: hypothetical protein V4654_04505 [Bdellovibrionota bacterium]
MINFLFAVLLVFSAQSVFATEIDQIKIKASLNLKRCDDVLVDGKFQNCVDKTSPDSDLIFDLTKNCNQIANTVNCSSSKSVTTRMDNGSATAIIVVSKIKDEAGSIQILATIMLTPGMNFSQQSVLNLTLTESGLFPPKIHLQASSYKPMDDSRLFFPSLVIN